MIKSYNNWIKHLLTPEQQDWCRANLEIWSVDVNGFVNVNGHVNIANSKFSKFPVKFGKISGNFWCDNCSLTTLEDGPYEVSLSCSYQRCDLITSLKGSPKEVGGNFNCAECTSLITIEGAPQRVVGTILHSKCPNLPKEHVELLSDRELYRKWISSGLPVDEFLKKTRGMIHGNKFGI